MTKRWKATAYIRDTRPESERSPRGRVRLGKPAVIVTESPSDALMQMERYVSELMPDLQGRLVQITIRSETASAGEAGNPLLATTATRVTRKGKKKAS